MRLQLTVVLKDINGNISAEDIPMPDGLQIIGQSRSQSFSMGTSGTSSSTSLQYTVRPLKEGIFTVPEWSVEYKGKTYTIAAATLKVDESAPAQQQAQQARDPFGMRSMFGLPSGIRSQSQARQQTQTFDDSLRNSANLEIKLPREEIYVGESVPCELIFSFSLRNGSGLHN
ncbi:MAG: BatD family protein [Bacilli bacterium]